jgi:hypothetical protein
MHATEWFGTMLSEFTAFGAAARRRLFRRPPARAPTAAGQLNIGARRFKCTSIPIVRRDYGVVGAICINIDINFVSDYVMASVERTSEFLRQ